MGLGKQFEDMRFRHRTDGPTTLEGASIPIAGEPDVIWYNPGKKRLYCAIAKPGVIDVIDTDAFGLIEEVVTEEGAHTLAFDARRQRLPAFLPKTQGVAVYSEV